MSYPISKYYIHLHNSIAKRNDITGDEKLLLATMYKWWQSFNSRGSEYTPSYKGLGMNVGMDSRQVEDAIRKLESLGFFTSSVSTNGGGRAFKFTPVEVDD